MFPHRNVHKYTCPDGENHKDNYHILIDRRWH
jgi:hypothetical protein